jgi:hypothetical protein
MATHLCAETANVPDPVRQQAEERIEDVSEVGEDHAQQELEQVRETLRTRAPMSVPRKRYTRCKAAHIMCKAGPHWPASPAVLHAKSVLKYVRIRSSASVCVIYVCV